MSDEPKPDTPPPPDADKPRGASTAVAERTRPAPSRTPPKPLPLYRVLLHNDDFNTVEFVVETLIELTPHNKQAATVIMLEAHLRGVALVLITHKERAELYRDQFASKRLTVTIEPVE